MLKQLLRSRPHPQGETIDRIHLYDAVSEAAFLGRRRRVYSRITALSGARHGDRVLDVGCNGGYLTRLLSRAVGPDGTVTGLDPSEQAIAHARRRAPENCRYTTGAAQDLEFPDASFDVVTCVLAMHHIPEPERAAAFAEIYRVLRPGGRLLVADFRPGSRPHAVRHGTPGKIGEMAAAAGFKAVGSGDLPLLQYLEAVRPDDA
jgi:ubiquinone/menaquinone biosynthesis C-methylase UbiE